jgi:hypothetical protein
MELSASKSNTKVLRSRARFLLILTLRPESSALGGNRGLQFSDYNNIKVREF